MKEAAREWCVWLVFNQSCPCSRADAMGYGIRCLILLSLSALP